MARKPSGTHQADPERMTWSECLYNFVSVPAGKTDDAAGTIYKGGHDGLMIHPESNAKFIVMSLTLILLLYLCIAVPLIIGFELEPRGVWGAWEVWLTY
jgi:hypothetical protein